MVSFNIHLFLVYPNPGGLFSKIDQGSMPFLFGSLCYAPLALLSFGLTSS